MYMEGAQYMYEINYEDISALFLLPKPDGGRFAFVISLNKTIRQGNTLAHLLTSLLTH